MFEKSGKNVWSFGAPVRHEALDKQGGDGCGRDDHDNRRDDEELGDRADHGAESIVQLRHEETSTFRVMVATEESGRLAP